MSKDARPDTVRIRSLTRAIRAIRDIYAARVATAGQVTQ